MPETKDRYELQINKAFCSNAEIRYRSGVMGWFNQYIKTETENLTPESIVQQLKHLTNFHFDYIDGQKIIYQEDDLRFQVDQEENVTRIYVFRKNEYQPTITLVKHW
jgi:hypothetical protein